jgi:hypothetical protein
MSVFWNPLHQSVNVSNWADAQPMVGSRCLQESCLYPSANSACSTSSHSQTLDVILCAVCCTDGVFISYIQSCEASPTSANGAVLYALPKWAVYRGATYFWVPVWNMWDVWRAAGAQYEDEQRWPMLFTQLQPAQPQRVADAAAEVAYFVTDVSVLLTKPLVSRPSDTIAGQLHVFALVQLC